MLIFQEVALINDTLQMSRFEEIPFPLTFNVWLFEVTNPEEALNNGIPILKERGPYSYKYISSFNFYSYFYVSLVFLA